MGRPKYLLPFGPTTMLERVVSILSEVVAPVVVVAASDQELPPLPDGVIVARDEVSDPGPLGGIAVGLDALAPYADAAYVSACDAPMLKRDFVVRLIEMLGDHDLAIPKDGRYHHPLAAVYRTDVAAVAHGLVAQERMRPVFLLEECNAREVDVADLREVDPHLDSLRNTNTPEAYAAAIRDAGVDGG